MNCFSLVKICETDFNYNLTLWTAGQRKWLGKLALAKLNHDPLV